MMNRLLWSSVIGLAGVVVAINAIHLFTSGRITNNTLTVVPAEIVVEKAETSSTGDDGAVCNFKVSNTGSTSVRIKRVSTNCGCTLAKPLSKSILAPGEHVPLTVVAWPLEEGDRKTTVLIVTDSPIQPLLKASILLKGKKDLGVPRMKHCPKKIHLTVDSYEVASREVEVRTVESRESPCWIRGLEVERGRCRVERIHVREANGPSDSTVERIYSYRVISEVSDGQRGDDASILKLRGSTALDSDIRRINVVTTITKPCRVVPESIFEEYHREDIALTRKRHVVVKNEYVSSPVHVTNVECPADWIGVTWQNDDSPGIAANISVDLRAPPNLQTTRYAESSLQIHTNHPRLPCFEVPIVLAFNSVEASVAIIEEHLMPNPKASH